MKKLLLTTSFVLLAGGAIFHGCLHIPNAGTQAAEEAQMLLNKGMAFAVQNNFNEAFEAFDECLVRFQHSKNPRVKEQVADTFVEKGYLYQHLHKPKEAYDVFNECIKRFKNDTDPQVRLHVVRASLCAFESLEMQDKPEEAMAVLLEVEKILRDEMDLRAKIHPVEEWLNGLLTGLPENVQKKIVVYSMYRDLMSNIQNETQRLTHPSISRGKAAKSGNYDRYMFGISDAWKQQHGLATDKNIGEDVCASGLMYWEAFHLGCNPLLRTTNPENEPFSDLEVYKRGFNPLEVAPMDMEERNRFANVTLIHLGLSGPGARYAKVCVGTTIHVGPTPREYTLRSGEVFTVIVERLPNVKGGAGLVVRVDLESVNGLVAPLEGWYGRFLLPDE